VKPIAVLLAIALWAAPALAASATGTQWGAQSRAVSNSLGGAGGPPGPAPFQDEAPLSPRPLAVAAASGGTARESQPQGAIDQLIAAAGRANAISKAGFAKQPALLLVLSAVLILPVAALASWAVQRSSHLRALYAAKPSTRRVGAAEGAHAVTDTQAWSARAWLAIEGNAAGARRIDCEMLRIGRHPDNEVWLTEDSVHRYHAVIHRTEDAEFIITDVSGEVGNGVRVNGTRLSKARLANGDVIELGRARLTFASTPI
jgi:hypothetical protein